MLTYNQSAFDFHKISFITTNYGSGLSSKDSVYAESIVKKYFNWINFDQISLLSDTNTPLLNFGSTNSEIQNLIENGKVSHIWNLPKYIDNARNKLMFHEILLNKSYIPKTYFSAYNVVLNCESYPIIAKPKFGKQGIGISKLNEVDFVNLDKLDLQYDIYCEYIDIDHEYRCIWFTDEILFISERIPSNDKSNSLRESKEVSKNEFDWVDQDITKIKWLSEASKILLEVTKLTNLDFIGADIAIDKNGKVWLIEINTQPGLNSTQPLDIYKKAFSLYYSRKVNNLTEIEIKRDLLNLQSSSVFKSNNKNTKLHECLLYGGLIDNNIIIAKNRDRVYSHPVIINQEHFGDVEVAYLYDTQSDWIEGLNEFGISLVNSRMSANKENKLEPKDQYKLPAEPPQDIELSTSNKAPIIKKILSCTNINDALIETQHLHGYSILTDGKKLYRIEKSDDNLAILDVTNEPYVIYTNHGILLPNTGYGEIVGSTERANSEIRYISATRFFTNINNTDELLSKLQSQHYDEDSLFNINRTNKYHFTNGHIILNPVKLEFIYAPTDFAKLESVNCKIKNPKIKVIIK